MKSVGTNIQFKIAFGRSKNETRWKTETISWADFVQKIKNVRRTSETFCEYQKKEKDQRVLAKDGPAFVGGPIAGNRRNKKSVSVRWMVTLDIDRGSSETSKKITDKFGCALILHSTHSHSPSVPRYRLIIPLSREVTIDEYAAISRKIAEMIDMESFDPTTFEHERLMYFPSASTDGEFIFEEQEGAFLDPANILKLYKETHWSDITGWPESKRAKQTNQFKTTNQAEDPTTKTGQIGAFCRTFTISAAIEEFLPDTYVPGTIAGRYSYAGGSTANGLVIYQDKWCYSHHATDPISGRLCNAFDLVRIHKYGNLDADVKEDIPIGKMPSFIEMCNLIEKNRQVKELQGQEVLKEFSGNTDWGKGILTHKNGKSKDEIGNIKYILSNDPQLKGCLSNNIFTCSFQVIKPLPWQADEKHPREYEDGDDAAMREYFETKYGITNQSKIRAAVDLIAIQNKSHPVRNYVKSLKWDGEKRIDTLFIDYLGVEDSLYSRTVSRKMMIAGVKRIMEPGCKFDTMLLLMGLQGTRKSELISRLGRDWFSDSMGSLTSPNNKAAESLRGVWLMEAGELSKMKRATIEEVKNFLSQREDRYRPAYGRRLMVYKRQCIFFGTSNNLSPLTDQTGNRRFWPLKVLESKSKYDPFEMAESTVDQMWAEAVVRYRKKETVYLDPAMESQAAKMQEKHTEEYGQAGLVIKYLETLLPDGWEDMGVSERISFLNDDKEMKVTGKQKRTKVCPMEIWCEMLCKKREDFSSYLSREITQFLRNLKDWKEADDKYSFKFYGQQRYFERRTD